jgi:2-polyprenyl-3-methyl-5-hydroxy-6-metoxy-1,4-benzoquinol methylase
MQADEHPLVVHEKPASLEEYCLHLIHQRAYETARTLASGKAVLDLGCNNGYGTEEIARDTASVIGIDVSEQAIKDAKRRYPNLDFRQYDGGKLPFADGQFDLVTSFQVIEHVVDVESYLSDICRVLKPHGLALFTTPNAAIRLDPGMHPWNRFHVREYTSEEFQRTLATVFPLAAVYGLFGAPELQEVETARCRRAREIARWRSGQALRSGSLASARMAATGIALRWLPARATAGIRALVRATQRALPRDRSFINRYSIADLVYRQHGLENALDLLATCTRDGTLPYLP